MEGNFDGYWLFKYLTENILTDGHCLSPYTCKRCTVFKQFDGLNFDGLAVKSQKRQNFPPSKISAIRHIEVEGGVVGSCREAGKHSVKTENSQMVSIGAIFSSTCHIKQLNSWPNASNSCVANYSWLSAYPGKMKPFKDHTRTCGCLTSLRNKQ